MVLPVALLTGRVYQDGLGGLRAVLFICGRLFLIWTVFLSTSLLVFLATRDRCSQFLLGRSMKPVVIFQNFRHPAIPAAANRR